MFFTALSEDGQILYRRGMVLVSKDTQTVACWRLEARVALFNSCGAQLTAGFQTMVWCGNVCQTAVVEHVSERRRDDSEGAELSSGFGVSFRDLLLSFPCIHAITKRMKSQLVQALRDCLKALK